MHPERGQSSEGMNEAEGAAPADSDASRREFAEEHGVLAGFSTSTSGGAGGDHGRPYRRCAVIWPNSKNPGGFVVAGPRSHLALIGLDLISMGGRDRRIVTAGSRYLRDAVSLSPPDDDSASSEEGILSREAMVESTWGTSEAMPPPDWEVAARLPTSQGLSGCTVKISECRMLVQSPSGDMAAYPDFNTRAVRGYVVVA